MALLRLFVLQCTVHQCHSGPEVLFKTCVAMKFVDDDDDDDYYYQYHQINAIVKATHKICSDIKNTTTA